MSARVRSNELLLVLAVLAVFLTERTLAKERGVLQLLRRVKDVELQGLPCLQRLLWEVGQDGTISISSLTPGLDSYDLTGCPTRLRGISSFMKPSCSDVFFKSSLLTDAPQALQQAQPEKSPALKSKLTGGARRMANFFRKGFSNAAPPILTPDPFTTNGGAKIIAVATVSFGKGYCGGASTPPQYTIQLRTVADRVFLLANSVVAAEYAVADGVFGGATGQPSPKAAVGQTMLDIEAVTQPKGRAAASDATSPVNAAEQAASGIPRPRLPFMQRDETQQPVRPMAQTLNRLQLQPDAYHHAKPEASLGMAAAVHLQTGSHANPANLAQSAHVSDLAGSIGSSSGSLGSAKLSASLADSGSSTAGSSAKSLKLSSGSTGLSLSTDKRVSSQSKDALSAMAEDITRLALRLQLRGEPSHSSLLGPTDAQLLASRIQDLMLSAVRSIGGFAVEREQDRQGGDNDGEMSEEVAGNLYEETLAVAEEEVEDGELYKDTLAVAVPVARSLAERQGAQNPRQHRKRAPDERAVEYLEGLIRGIERSRGNPNSLYDEEIPDHAFWSEVYDRMHVQSFLERRRRQVYRPRAHAVKEEDKGWMWMDGQGDIVLGCQEGGSTRGVDCVDGGRDSAGERAALGMLWDA